MPRIPFDWSFPYPSQRMPVLAKNIVTTSQPVAAQAGLSMLQRGGNAVDAAVATAMALTVCEPTSNGIGSDAFALIWIDGELHGINGSGKSPAGLSPSDFAGENRVPPYSWGAVTVPGAVSTWVEVAHRFGTLPLEDLAKPAISIAREGFLVAPQTAGAWSRVPRGYGGQPTIRDAFAPEGRTPAAGAIWSFPEQADTLEQIALTNGKAFYEGSLAEQIVNHAQQTGGKITLDDLASHAPEWVDPISIDYRGFRLHEIPPNGQGLAALLMLGIARHFDLADMDPDCPDTIHLQIEAMKCAFADAHRYIADPQFMDVEVADLLAPSYLESRASLIDPLKATDFKHGEPKEGGTVLLCTADAGGTMVSFIQSNYTGFGSGIVIPDTGISMQNRGACFVLDEGHPNQVAGGKRPYHTIIPAFVTRPGADGREEPVMAFGVMGGYMQPQGHAQMMIRLADYGQNPQAALDAPRWQVDRGVDVTIEPGFSDEVYQTLRDRGHNLRVARTRTVAFGGGQAIYKLDDGYFGASDLRRDGQAVGY